MKLVRHISTIAFYLTRVIAAGYILTALYIILCVAFNLSTLQHLPDNRFAICYPFTSQHFLLGSEYATAYIAEMVLLIFIYGVFFVLLSNVFKSFKPKKIFTLQGIHHLRLFYLINLLIFPILFLILYVYSVEDYPYGFMIIAHCIMGIFALFIAAIFKQGLNLQNDQDLII
ncbi:DUF2975 family protein [Pedobacter psychrotolerans]|uniref:DUF2975 family protein n=1 Tax=Pedobacter psychrotolerans TaxID=1843235 RepID=A0A4V2RYR1_9SPHI|nr:DUF2975 domain-containing protein [Pedobacter psychrotolerans]TCO21456.1 DUF2975 family protein [Pedobacter psychrotolerans]